jgi:hypothetical protein
MPNYKIHTTAYEINYAAECRTTAILAYIHDAGYASISDAASVCDKSEAEFLANIIAGICDASPSTWTCSRCKETMKDRDCAEGCEDRDCPALGGEN